MKLFRKLLLTCCFVLLAGISHADIPVSKSFLGDVAIGGHDTTAYFEHQRPEEGDKTYTVNYSGAEWRFISAEQAEKFRANPEKYLPAYGGHCSNALSLGEGLIKTDGTIWHIFDNQLHLFYARRGLDRWLEGDYKEYKTAADAAWQQELTR